MFLPATIDSVHNTPQLPSHRGRGGRRATQVACLVCLAALATGCKTGSSMSSSWLGLGMGGPDPATLAEAPPFEGNTTKPSATAKPYPTTSTPESYALQQEALPEAAGQVAAAAPQTPVTYGSTPVPAEQPAAATAAVATAAPAAQVGPYQQMPAAPAQPSAAAGFPAAATMANDTTAGYGQPQSRFSQASPGVTSPAADLSSQPSGRFSAVADQRVAESQPTAASATAAFGSRYGSPPPAAAASPVTAAEAGQYGTAPAASRYGGTTASAFGSPDTQSPPPVVTPPAATPAATSFPEPAVMPEQPAGPIGEGLPAPPTSRRPDPGYRPGGTSSYRAAQPIYAEAPLSVPATAATPADEQVTPASFEAELGMPRQSQP
jgi:hypothetical protein